MRKRSLDVALVICAWAVPLLPLHAPAQRTLRVTGEIMDSVCAIDGIHDHMRATGTHDARACTLACAQMGGSFVLFDPATKTVYQLDDQKQPAPFTGEKVVVSGEYVPEESRTIQVESVQPSR